MKLKFILIALGLGLFLASCGEDFDCAVLELNIGATCDDGNANTENDVVTANCTCEGTLIAMEVTYTNTINSLLSGSCAVSPGCHGAGSSVFELTTFDQTVAAVGFGKMVGAINQDAGFVAMPPGGKLSAADIENFTTWVDNGMPE